MERGISPRRLAPISLRAARSVAAFRLRLIGGFTLQRYDEPVALPAGAQRLLAYLALQTRPVIRGRVAGTFWPETTDERAMGNLRTTLWRLNHPHAEIVVATGDVISLAAGVSVDLHLLSAFARAVLDGDSEPDASGVEELAGAGDLLPDWSDDWVMVERERFRQLRLHALERLSGRLLEAGRYGRAVEVCLVAVSSEPLRESAQRELMRAHLAEGNVSEAVRQYEAYRVLLLDELGVEPSAAMTDLLGRSGVSVPVRIGRSAGEGVGVPRSAGEYAERIGSGS